MILNYYYKTGKLVVKGRQSYLKKILKVFGVINGYQSRAGITTSQNLLKKMEFFNLNEFKKIKKDNDKQTL
jgi:hypothetical protein